MIDPINKTIDGENYEIAPFAAVRGYRLQLRLGKIVGPAIRAALSGSDGDINSIGDINLDAATIGALIGALIEELSVNDQNGELLIELFSQTQRNGILLTAPNIDKAYAANYVEMGKALFAIIQANNFFGAGVGGLASAISKNSNASQDN
ncbi:MAG: hypothetical protein IBX56_02325 [Methylomicrobium sp.]|nr:hypothetical protein [Methylomicrobium sp.]